MIERIIKEYFDRSCDVPVFFEREAGMPSMYVVVEKTGSGRRDYVSHATVAFQSYAPTLEQAAELNERVKDCVTAMATLDTISAVRLNSDYNFTDASTKQYRYQAVFDIYY